MPKAEQLSTINNTQEWARIIDSIDTNLAGRALHLTVQVPSDPYSALFLSRAEGVLATHVDSETSWQLWDSHTAADQSLDDPKTHHYGVIRGVETDHAVIVPYAS